MKVIHALAFYLPANLGGTELYAHELAKSLAEQSLSVGVLLPNQGKREWTNYTYEGISVTKYPEPSGQSRAIIQGRDIPVGIQYFKQYLLEKQPDIIHFHEITGSIGITIHHLRIAYELGIKVVFTMHLPNYTCSTGYLLYKNEKFCDGKIELRKCAGCKLIADKKLPTWQANTLTLLSELTRLMSIDPRITNTKIGTALAGTHAIQNLATQLQQIDKYCSKIITVSNWYKEVLLLNGVTAHKVSYIPQALPVQDSISFTQGDLTFPLRLVYVGRIYPIKGIELLIEAIQSLDAEKIQLNVIGEVTDEAYGLYCKKLAEDAPNIRFVGRLSREATLQQIAKSHLLCLSSYSEMSPLVIQEAFALGVPVIGSTAPGIREQIQPGYNGLLFQLGDAVDLANQLRMVLEDMTLIEKLRQHIVPPNNFATVAEAYKNLYKEILH